MYPHPYYPVGSIYLSVVNTNPATWFGGTWSLIAQGRTLVGVDTNDTDFNTVQKTGGKKRHQHDYGMRYHGWCADTILENANRTGLLTFDDNNNYTNTGFGTNIDSGATANVNDGLEQTTTSKTSYLYEMIAKTSNTSNVMPYFTCYIWCRTA